MNNIIKEIEQIEAGGLHGQLPVVWKKAKGEYVWDNKGNRYIDFTSTIFVANCGHSAVSNAIIKQAKNLIHSYTFPTEIKWKFLKTFKKFLPDFCDRIFLASAGSEVASWAIQLMRQYSGKKTIVHIDGAFHGKTGEAEALSQEEIKISFPTSVEQWSLYDFINLQSNVDNIAGIMIESYQGWSARFMDKEYIKLLVQWAKVNDIPVCFDEIQGGFWRTGKKFAYEWYEVEPDLICMGKGLGGGTPLSALAGREKYFNVPGLSSTHSGNPLCCAAGLEALNIYNKINKDELNNKSEILSNSLYLLKKYVNSKVVDVHSHGLLASIIFHNKELATEVCEKAMRHGLLVVKTGRESIKIGPPLTISEKTLVKGIRILQDIIADTK